MRPLYLSLLALVGLASVITPEALAQTLGREVMAEVRPEWGHYFERFDAAGTFVVYNRSRDQFIRYNPERAEQRFIPASTFKIFNSLVALETGVIEDVNTVLPWDSVQRRFTGWNRDHNMRSAFRQSVVWFYQELARRIGEERMRFFVEREGYGNEDIGGGIDQFWLTGDLRISPNEQVELLWRLYNSELAFSRPAMETVREIMVIRQTPEYTLRGKTGWAEPDQDGVEIGWLVGWVERADNTYFFALNLKTRDPDFPMLEARQGIAYGILRELAVLPAAEGT